MLPLREQLREFEWLLRHRGARALGDELIDIARGRLPFASRSQWFRADVDALDRSLDVTDDYVVATERDLPRLAGLVTPHTRAEMAEYIARPDRYACLIHPRTGPAMNQLCVAYESLTQGGITVDVPPDAIYMFAGFTHPRARRRGLARSSISYACQRLDHGRRTSWAWIDTRNAPQRGVMFQLGFEARGVDALRRPMFGASRRRRYEPH